MRNTIIKYIIVCFMLQVSLLVRGEIYTLDQAREMFNRGEYVEAAPTFAKELKKKPKNGSINHWYGVCLYHMGCYDEAVDYLKYGITRKVGMSHYYLGRTYAALYKFDEAIAAYEGYVEFYKKEKKEPTEDVTPLIAYAKKVQRMMRGVERVQVIDSLAVDSLSFIEAFKLTHESGQLIASKHLPIPSLQEDESAVAYVPQRGDMIYMGSKVNDNYDLCVSNHLLGQGWAEMHSLSQVLNTVDNQNYPFLLSDGQTLYFAQDGESSLGGYDIYVTMFNSERGDFMLPQNVGMPFNSPYNDFMMAIDESLGVGWFVTDRNHIPGKLTIYLFLPNEQKAVYSKDDPRIASLAQLTSIADTWPEDADYSAILAAINEIEPVDVEHSFQEFTFVVCDEIVYTRSDEFKNAEALRYYNQARTLQQKIDETHAMLDSLRVQYMKATAAEKERLATEILRIEEEMLNSKETPAMYENRARRAEMAFLNLPIE